MAAERFPSEVPTFYWDERQPPAETFRILDRLDRDLRTRLIKVLNDHADLINALTVSTTSAIRLFEDTITEDFTIPAGRNGLSVDLTIASGVTVTVTIGQTFVIL